MCPPTPRPDALAQPQSTSGRGCQAADRALTPILGYQRWVGDGVATPGTQGRRAGASAVIVDAVGCWDVVCRRDAASDAVRSTSGGLEISDGPPGGPSDPLTQGLSLKIFVLDTKSVPTLNSKSDG